MASGILLSRFSGLARESAIARVLGAGRAADAFKAALQIPNLVQNLLGEGVLSAAFIPVLSRVVDDDDPETEGRVAGSVAGLLVAVGLLMAAAMALAAPLVVSVVTPGFRSDDTTFELTVTLTRIVVIGVFLQVVSAWCLGVLNTHRRFFLSYVAPVIWNATQVVTVVIVGLMGWANASVATALAWSLVVGALLQVAVQVPTIRQLVPELRISLDRSLPEVREVIRRTGPAVLGRGAVQISGFLDLLIASLASAGTLATLSYAQLLYLLPISVFAMSVAAAELPEMAVAGPDELHRRITSGLGRIGFFLVFVTAAYVAGGRHVVGLVFEGGDLGADRATVIWLTVAVYSIGLVASGSSRLLQNALYARDDVRGPARIALIRVGVAAVLGYVLMCQFDHLSFHDGTISGWEELPAAPVPLDDILRSATDVDRLGAVGLAMGSAVASWVELALLRSRTRSTLAWPPPLWRANRRFVPPALLAGAEMLLMADGFGGLPPILLAPLVVGGGAVTFLAGAVYMRCVEAEELLRPLRSRLPSHRWPRRQG